METYKEFKLLNRIDNNKYPYLQEFMLDDGSIFFIEPNFYTQLKRLIILHPNKLDNIINQMFKLVKKNKKVVFCGDFELPYTNFVDFIYLEIHDITNPLSIYIEDKSRGSNYGD